MNIHKCTRFTLLDLEEIWRLYQTRPCKVVHLAECFHANHPTIYDVLKYTKLNEFTLRDSTNQRFKTLQYVLKRLTMVVQTVQDRLKRDAKCYNKSYPGELVHFDTKQLSLLTRQSAKDSREYLFVSIDDFSRGLYADILPDKTQHSTASFLLSTAAQCPYQIDYAYSDNGKEFKGTDDQSFVKACRHRGIG